MGFSNLRQVLVERGITVYRLGKLTGISTSDLYSSLAGKRCMFPGWRRRIAQALNMSEIELFPELERGEDQ